MLGDRGWRVWCVRIPRAEARLVAIEELKSRGGRRRGRLGNVRRGEAERGPKSDFEARSSATAADVDSGFSAFAFTSGSPDAVVEAFSVGKRRISDIRWCCSSRSRNVLRASALPVPAAAFANSPAARACSLMATVVSPLWVAMEAARA